MDRRTELINEIEDYMRKVHWNWSSHRIADFILFHENAIFDEIEKPLKRFHKIVYLQQFDPLGHATAVKNNAVRAIDEALSIIERRKKT